jgi:hypothetical protein
MGTHWEVEGNIVTTHGNKGKNGKLVPPHPQLRREKIKAP